MQDPQTLYTRRVDRYVAFVSTFAHQQGIAALLLGDDLLHDGMRVLDAGCGTGFATLALLEALGRRGFTARKIEAFDLTPAMLARFEAARQERGLSQLEIRQADARQLSQLPPTWTGYDLILSVSMLEYLPREELPGALRGLRERLAPGGRMVIIITRKNPLTWLLIEKAWQANRYTRGELASAFRAAGCRDLRFSKYPGRYFWLNFSNHVVLAR